MPHAWTRRLVFLIPAVAASWAVADRAHAQVCVAIDEARDTLSPDDRRSAQMLMGQQFAQQGLQVVQPPCSETYTLSHIKFGKSITVNVSGPRGSRVATAASMDDIPPLYSQMVHSLITGAPLNGLENIDRTNVTVAQAAPLREEADSLWYARLGYGLTLGSTKGGPAVGFGYRYELDSLGIDASFFNMTFPDSNGNDNSKNSFSGSLVKLMVLHFFSPTANNSLYVGGGVAWGWALLANDTTIYSGSGLQGEFSAGYELLRASTIRIFGQADFTLPFYSASREVLVSSTDTGPGTKYAPTIVLSVGLGWGHSRTTSVRVLN